MNGRIGAGESPAERIATRRLAPDDVGVAEAAEILRAGGLVAFPTETVYGLGARADDPAAVARIYEAKGRPDFNPLIVHVADLAAAAALAEIPEAARALAERHWPGPLTLALPRRPGAALAPAVSAGLPTVAVRVPALPLARRLLEKAGVPIAAPSANRSGKVSPTTADHVLDELSGRIEAVLDGGPCPVGVESTILAFEDGRPVLLRAGGVPAEAVPDVRRRLPPASAPGEGGRAGAEAGGTRPLAPGMLASHYAPAASLRLDAEAPRAGEAWLGFGPDPAPPPPLSRNLSPSGDLAEAAANLFAFLRELDAACAPGAVIAVAPVPRTGLGAAINDRLARAAAPRPKEPET